MGAGVGAGAGLAIAAAAPLATEAQATESDAEAKKKRYNPNSEDVKNYLSRQPLLGARRGRGAAAARERSMPADAVMPISVVIERRASNTPGRIMCGGRSASCRASPASRGQVLASGEGWAQFYGGDLDIELFRGETDGYLTNLSQATPVVYVVLRRNARSRRAGIRAVPGHRLSL